MRGYNRDIIGKPKAINDWPSQKLVKRVAVKRVVKCIVQISF